jgi:hypothetical protein
MICPMTSLKAEKLARIKLHRINYFKMNSCFRLYILFPPSTKQYLKKFKTKKIISNYNHNKKNKKFIRFLTFLLTTTTSGMTFTTFIMSLKEKIVKVGAR